MAIVYGTEATKASNNQAVTAAKSGATVRGVTDDITLSSFGTLDVAQMGGARVPQGATIVRSIVDHAAFGGGSIVIKAILSLSSTANIQTVGATSAGYHRDPTVGALPASVEFVSGSQTAIENVGLTYLTVSGVTATGAAKTTTLYAQAG